MLPRLSAPEVLARVGRELFIPKKSFMAPFAITLSSSGRIVFVVAHGQWTRDEVNEHFDNLAAVVRLHRGLFGRARVLIDLREASVQARDVAQEVNLRTTTTYQSGDMVAVVTRTALLRLQMRRVQGAATYAVFDNREAGLEWLECSPS